MNTGTPHQWNQPDAGDVIRREPTAAGEDNTFDSDAGAPPGHTGDLELDLRRPRLVSESEDYTNVSYDLYAMSVSRAQIAQATSSFIEQVCGDRNDV